MAGTATRYDSTLIRAGTVGQLWAGLAVPAADARLTLDADGTPDATANPNATHLGHTAAGLTGNIGYTVTDLFVDESPFPVRSTSNAATMTLSGDLVQIFDAEVLQFLTAPFGTYSTTANSHHLVQVGTKATLPYDSIAAIWPTNVTGEYAVFHIYNGLNTGGLQITIDRQGRSQSPFTITGYALTAREAADTMGAYWYSIP